MSDIENCDCHISVKHLILGAGDLSAFFKEYKMCVEKIKSDKKTISNIT